MKIAVETLTPEVFAEIAPLGQEAWDECSEIKKDTCAFHGERGFKIIPDAAKYVDLQKHDSLAAFTLRDDDGVLQGYSLVLLYNSLHHSPVKCANVDTFYVRQEKRAGMRSFIAFIESQLMERGVHVVGWPVTPKGALFGVLQKLEYAPDDVVMEKRLCALSLGQ